MPFFKLFVETMQVGLRGSEDDEVLGTAGQDIRSGRRDDQRVLDADAADAGEVDARLDGDRHARLQCNGRRGADLPTRTVRTQERLLVDLQPDAVSGAVDEGAGVA